MQKENTKRGDYSKHRLQSSKNVFNDNIYIYMERFTINSEKEREMTNNILVKFISETKIN